MRFLLALLGLLLAPACLADALSGHYDIPTNTWGNATVHIQFTWSSDDAGCDVTVNALDDSHSAQFSYGWTNLYFYWRDSGGNLTPTDTLPRFRLDPDGGYGSLGTNAVLMSHRFTWPGNESLVCTTYNSTDRLSDGDGGVAAVVPGTVLFVVPCPPSGGGEAYARPSFGAGSSALARNDTHAGRTADLAMLSLGLVGGAFFMRKRRAGESGAKKVPSLFQGLTRGLLSVRGTSPRF